MMFERAKRFTVTKGHGRSSVSRLNAFDKAMIDASIGELNIIEVSSVLPEGIVKTDEIDCERGDFIPAVMSKAIGTDGELVAGLAWGFREDDKGGYVMEGSNKGEDIDIKIFEVELKRKLSRMGEARDCELIDIGVVSEKMSVEEDEFGCVLSGLVYQS